MSAVSFLKRWFQRSRQSLTRVKPRPKARPAFEAHEERWCAAFAVDIYDLSGLGNSPSTAVKIAKATPSSGAVLFSCGNLSIDSANDVDYYAFRLEGTATANSFFKINFVQNV